MTEMLDRKALTAQVDRLLLQQGRLDPLELLLALDLLSYEDYQDWRLGRRASLQDALSSQPAAIAALLEQAMAYARGQGLKPTPLKHRGWGGHDVVLHIGTNQALNQACASALEPAADRCQLDLFHDSHELLLETGIRDALARHRLADARDRLAELMHHNPRHGQLRGYLQLLQVADEGGQEDVDEAASARLEVLDGIEPLARDLLGHQARDFLSALWAELAQRLARASFDPASPRLHASHAWSRAERWDAVRAAVEQEPLWRDQPFLLTLHAEAAWRRRDPATAQRDWAWMCWEHPHQAERLLNSPTFPDQQLQQLWQAFEDLDVDAALGSPPGPADDRGEILETEDFPAWLLLHDLSSAAAMPPEAAPDDERGAGYRILHGIISGDDSIALRRELDDVHPLLLRLFLASLSKD